MPHGVLGEAVSAGVGMEAEMQPNVGLPRAAAWVLG